MLGASDVGRLKAMMPAVGVAAVLAAAAPAKAQNPIADFYSGKVVNLVVTTGGGTGYDYGARVLSRHVRRHIPGNPTVVVQNRPGGGGRTGTAHVYSVAPRDGTVIGAVQSFIATDPRRSPARARSPCRGTPRRSRATQTCTKRS